MGGGNLTFPFAGRTIGNYPSPPPASDVTKNCDEPEETLKRKKICAIIGGEGIERFPRDGQVAVAPHNDGDFFHGFHSFHAVRVGRVFHARAAQK